MRKAEEIERFWLSFTSFKTLLFRKSAKPEQPRLLGMQLETELLKALLEIGPILNRFSFMLEAHVRSVKELSQELVLAYV